MNKRILMVSPNPVCVEKDGGGKASRNKLISLLSQNNELIFFSALSSKVDTVCPHRSDNDNNASKTYYFRQRIIFGKCLMMFTDFNLGFLSKIRKIVSIENIDLICITEPVGIVSTSIVCRNIPVLYNACDVVSELVKITFQSLQMDFTARMPIISRILKVLFIYYFYFLERLACKRAKHIITLTELDRQRFIEKYGVNEDKITTIPVWMAVKNERPCLREKELLERHKLKVLFHGTYSHFPNYEAFKLIENYIAPEVWKRNQNIQFVLAGTDTPQFERGNIKSVGHVKNLDIILENSHIAIVPVLQGTGVRMKILDYMAAGLPIITTRKAIEGIDAKDGEHAVILDTVDERFILAILDIASDKGRRERLGRNAMELIARCYSREKIQAKLDEVLAKLKGK